MGLVMFWVVALDPVSYALAVALVAKSLTFVAAGALMLVTAVLDALSCTVRTFD